MNALRRLFAVAVVGGFAYEALAGFTSPQLALTSAVGVVVDGGRSVVLQAGDLDFPNTVQGGTALHVILSQGNAFVRYPLHGAAVVGTSTTLADHQVDDVEADIIVGEGSAAPAGVRIVALSATSLTIALPASFTPGSCYAQLLSVGLTPAQHAVVSNVVPFTLP
jgi:hypothetical protein